jgi:hypothetical protein
MAVACPSVTSKSRPSRSVISGRPSGKKAIAQGSSNPVTTGAMSTSPALVSTGDAREGCAKVNAASNGGKAMKAARIRNLGAVLPQICSLAVESSHAHALLMLNWQAAICAGVLFF